MADPKKKKEEDERSGGGLVPKTKVRVGPDRRAQATLRAAERPKVVTDRYHGSTTTVIKNPAVGIASEKEAIRYQNTSGTESNLTFNRYKPGSDAFADYDTKKERSQSQPKPSTVDGLHKDRLRGAAVRHAMGRQLTDVRPGNEVYAQARRSSSGRNPRARAYEQQTGGALNFDRGRNDDASSTKLTKTTWQPSNTKQRVTFNPNTLKDSLKAMAQGSVVRASTKLIGGPIAQIASMVDDAVAGATGKRPSKEIAKAHTKEQSKLINELQIKKKKQAPWVGSGPF